MEKDDPLERFVLENRGEFDVEKPSSKGWENIQQRLPKTPATYSYLWKVASILFFGLSVFFALDKYGPSFQENTTARKDEFKKVELYYMQELDQKMTLIKNVSGKNFMLNPGSEQDLQKLDAMYLVLKEEFQANPSSRVMDALLLNLLIRVDILNNELYDAEMKKGVMEL
ncbi:MAG: hypothetical protein OEY51_10055 [Cyclobacteriaceae bacterium]|nr:hypothetical protein [Cyclobacteriaceae bacterium]